MDHNITLISTIAAAFGLALVFGFIAEKIKVPALVGYLLAGIVISPNTPGYVGDIEIAAQLSEIGVMLLMFGVGLHFSLNDLLAVKRIAVPGAIVQMTVATVLGTIMAMSWGWTFGSGLVLGLSLSCASTVVLLQAIESRGLLESMNGRIAVGWLIVEDLVTVLILVLLPTFAVMLGGVDATADAANPWWMSIGITLLLVSVFIAIMLIVGRRFLPWLLLQVAGTGSRELFTLTVIASAICIAFIAAKLFNVSFALGAFFAGMVMRESHFSHRAAEESLPLRDAFSVLFFVSVGMLFDPRIFVDEPLQVLSVVGIIIIGKSLAALLLVLILRYPLNTALTVAASLGQIGEFSFILAGLGASLGLLSSQGMSLVLAGAIISIAFNPIAFGAVAPIRNWLLKYSALARKYENRDDPYAELPMNTESKFLQGQVVLVGYGHVGKRIGEGLMEHDIPFVVAEQKRELVQDLRKQGIKAVSGDAAEPSVLIQAHITNATMLIIATPDLFDMKSVVDTARTLNPEIEIVVHARTEDETILLRKDNIGTIFFEEEELAKNMTHHILNRFDSKTKTVSHKTV